jgi:hypothetical protein
MPILYDAIHCSRNDTLAKRNLWDCSSVIEARPGHCDPNTESAGVTCEGLPVHSNRSSDKRKSDLKMLFEFSKVTFDKTAEVT